VLDLLAEVVGELDQVAAGTAESLRKFLDLGA